MDRQPYDIYEDVYKPDRPWEQMIWKARGEIEDFRLQIEDFNKRRGQKVFMWEVAMKRTIFAFLIILVFSFSAFAGETVRIYDMQYQLKYIYDVESGRVYDTRYQLQYRVENNRVYDSRYQPIYMYDPDKGTIYDYGYNLQYKIEGNTVYDTKYYPVYNLERR